MFFEVLPSSPSSANSGRQTAFGDGSGAAPVVAALPHGVAHTERAAAALRAYLIGAGLAHYRIFYVTDLDLYDLDHHLAALGESAAAWEAAPAAVAGGETIGCMTHDASGARGWDTGCIRLSRFDVVLARWYWSDPNNGFRQLWLCAVAEPAAYFKLRQAVLVLRRVRGESVWQVVHGGYDEPERLPREPVADEDLLLSDSVRRRIENEVVHFFSDEVAALYKGLRVPYRRGVLLHGPPGNGKTSLIRFIGGRLPELPVLLLRPESSFDSDDLEGVIKRWSEQAPAVLVVEDLDWLLKQVNVSTFLNLLDGVDSAVGGGLMMIATTNHPDALDPAINNRPGRFDVVMEVPSPDEPLRLRFLSQRLPEASSDALREAARATQGLAFAHLHEVLRLSGFLAIAAGRPTRSDDDVIAAARQVRQSFDDARRGFPSPAEQPFGLAHIHAQRRQQRETADTASA